MPILFQDTALFYAVKLPSIKRQDDCKLAKLIYSSKTIIFKHSAFGVSFCPQHSRFLLLQAELLKVQRRREDREQEKEQREREQEQLARDRAVAEAVELEKKEDEVRCSILSE